MAQRGRATQLYRSLLRTTREVFRGDERALQAAHAETRRRFIEARNETDADTIAQNLELGEQVNYLLKHNVVQGVAKPDDDSTYRLRFTPHTELGSNDTIKNPKPAPTLAAIQKAKNATRGVRAFSTSAAPRDDTAPLPRPVPRFPGIVILADGSSVRLTTTSPRYVTRMARDYTNHPLWNPMMDRRTDTTDEDVGRLGRFRRRFGEGDAQHVSFDEDDLSWMSGGRESLPGASVKPKKGKGKGKRK